MPGSFEMSVVFVSKLLRNLRLQCNLRTNTTAKPRDLNAQILQKEAVTPFAAILTEWT